MEINLSLQNILLALGLTLIAGMSTGIGALLAFFTRATNTKVIATALGLSAGVMVYISFMELLPEAMTTIDTLEHGKMGKIYVLATFFGGMALAALIDFFIPEDENPHEYHDTSDLHGNKSTAQQGSRLKRTGFMLALAIGIHNFPEGIATFVSALEGIEVALPIVIAIAIHNIPEGIAVSVPIYHTTGNRRKALTYTFLTGLAEPIGALFGFMFLIPFWTPVVSSLLLSAVAGIMVFISFDELLPSAEGFGHHHYSIGGVIGGMVIMAISLVIL